MAVHAILSASSAHRWIHCPPSARLEEKLESTLSVFAEEGTFMHALAECYLRKCLGMMSEVDYRKAYKELQVSEFYNYETTEAVEAYVSLAMEYIEDAKRRCKDPVILIEQRLDFSNYVPEGFGTGDLVIVADGVLQVVDLKGGKGIAVDAYENPQMMLYP